MEQTDFHGYIVSYDREEGPFPVYVAGFIATILIASAFVAGSTIVFLLGFAAAAFAYYNYPLIETGRPRLGANQYGVFIDRFGIVPWRAIDRIELATFAVRQMTLSELHIALKQPISSALIADWRRVPFYRQGMRLSWSMTPDNVVRVTLDHFADEPDAIHRTLLRMWRYYRS